MIDTDMLEKVLSELTTRERMICKYRIMEGWTLAKVAKKFKCSPGRIWQMEKEVLFKLRHPCRSKRLLEASDGLIGSEQKIRDFTQGIDIRAMIRDRAKRRK